MGEYDFNGTRILIVEDDKALADNLTAFSTRLGYAASAVYSGGEALKAFQSEPYPLVIADLKLPDMPGLELIEALKSINRHSIVIVITGDDSIDASVAAIRKGAYDFISKPFDQKDVDLLIYRALEKYTLLTRLRKTKIWSFCLLASLPIWFLLGYFAVKLFK